jgi:hypothetical protein
MLHAIETGIMSVEVFPGSEVRSKKIQLITNFEHLQMVNY